jgi:hypothetical protein
MTRELTKIVYSVNTKNQYAGRKSWFKKKTT